MDAYLPTVAGLNQSAWKSARKRAIASKEPYCSICGKWIDTSLPMKDPKTGAFNALAVEVDHIVPRSRGGDIYAVENLQLSHSSCNRKKGAKMESDYLPDNAINPFPISHDW